MTLKEHVFINRDELQWDINRMIATDDKEYLRERYDRACKNLSLLYKAKLRELNKEDGK